MIEKYQTLGMINEAYMLTFIFVGEKGDPGDIEQCECKFPVKTYSEDADLPQMLYLIVSYFLLLCLQFRDACQMIR